jgi:uncharacterized MAPEG superfamily protein
VIGNILTPAAVLVVWSIVMLAWMGAARGPALRALGTDKLKRGARGQDLEGLLDDRINCKAHNYVHLHEQPTVFYAAVFILVLSGYGETQVWLAWAYTVLRIAHSVWQAAINTQPVRMLLFLASSLAMAVLAVQALLATL